MSSGRRLFSLNSKSKIIVFVQQKKEKKKNIVKKIAKKKIKELKKNAQLFGRYYIFFNKKI